MQAQFVHNGDFIDYTPDADVAAGEVVVQDALVGIATRPIAANTLGSLAVRGVFKVAASDAFPSLGPVYWNESSKEAKPDILASAGDVYMGVNIDTGNGSVVTVLLGGYQPAKSA